MRKGGGSYSPWVIYEPAQAPGRQAAGDVGTLDGDGIWEASLGLPFSTGCAIPNNSNTCFIAPSGSPSTSHHPSMLGRVKVLSFHTYFTFVSLLGVYRDPYFVLPQRKSRRLVSDLLNLIPHFSISSFDILTKFVVVGFSLCGLSQRVTHCLYRLYIESDLICSWKTV